jgi:hypothetical protein
MQELSFRSFSENMAKPCSKPGCKAGVPASLDSQGVCVQHYVLAVERACAEMRRETVLGRAPQERQVEIISYIGQQGELLARIATSGLHLPDEMKARLLNTFLTLINLRENLDRAVLRQPLGRTGSR